MSYEAPIVFFDWNRADLNAEAIAILKAAPHLRRQSKAKQIRIVAGTDRSGSRAYNLDLSRRRVEAVAELLRGQGMSRADMVLVPTGEDEPLIATQDGQRKPVNRYASIHFKDE